MLRQSTHFKLFANAKSKLSHDVAYFFSDNVPTSMLIVRFLEILGVILLSFALLSRVVANYRMRNPEDTFIWDGILTVISGMYTLTKVMSKHRPGTGTIKIEPRREKIGFLHMRKQRRRSASR